MADVFDTIHAGTPSGGGTDVFDQLHAESQPGFFESLWGKANPVAVAKGVAGSVMHPIDSLKSWRDQSQELHDKAVDAFNGGDYEAAAVHGINFLANVVPGLGKAMDEAAEAKTPEEFKSKLGAAAGTAIGLKELQAAPKIVSKIVQTVPKAANAVSRVGSVISDVSADPKVRIEAGGAAGALVGAGIGGATGHATGVPMAGYVGASGGAYLGRRLGSAVTERLLAEGEEAPVNAKTPPPPVEGPPLSPGGIPTGPDLPGGGTAADQLAAELARRRAANAPPPPEQRTGPVNIGEPIPAGKTLEERLQEDLAAKRAANPPGPEVQWDQTAKVMGFKDGIYDENMPNGILNAIKDGRIKPPRAVNPNPADLGKTSAPPEVPQGRPYTPEPEGSGKTLQQYVDEDIAKRKAAREAQNPPEANAGAQPEAAPEVAPESAQPEPVSTPEPQAAPPAAPEPQQPATPEVAAPVQPEVAPAQSPTSGQANPIPKDFGPNELSDMPVLPGHTQIRSSTVHSVGFDPETGHSEIHFKKPFPNGGLYRYPNLPPEELVNAVREAPSFGAWTREVLRANPEWTKGYKKVSVPENKPLLSEANYAAVPKAESVAPPEGKNGTIASSVGPEAQAGSGGPEPRGMASQGPAVREALKASGGADPAATSVIIPGTNQEFPARYEVRELADINASHNGVTFQPNPKYGLTNERDYTDPENQRKIVEGALPSNFQPRLHITDNPDATNGPVVIKENGDALGGNGRKMMLDRVYKSNPAGAQDYKKLLVQKAGQFGIDPEQVSQMKEPVLTRKVNDADVENAASAINDLNKVGTSALRPNERTIADSRRISPSTLSTISDKMDKVGPDANLSHILVGQSGVDVLNKLTEDGAITPQERAGLVQEDSNGNQILTPGAKDRISKVLLGRFFRDPAQMDTISPTIKSKVQRIAPALSSAEEVPGWGVGDHMQQALDLIERTKAAGRSNIDEFLKQNGLFGNQQYAPETVNLAKSLQNTTQSQALKAANNYLEKARYQRDYQGPGMFGNFPEPVTSATALKGFLEDIRKSKIPPQVAAAIAKSRGE